VISAIKKLFGGGKTPPPPGRDVAELVAPLSKPAAQLVKTPGPSRSFLGGPPLLPTGVAWPSKDGKALTFLACLDLESLRAVLPLDWLPSTGRLLFFYDVDAQPWGFDPKDRGAWAVLHITEPPGPPGATAAPALPQQFVTFRAIVSYPSWERPDVSALGLSDREAEVLIDLGSSVYGDSARHQVGGFPEAIQSDAMEYECQMVSNGLYLGDATPPPGAKALEPGAKDWRLLFQMDGDDELGVMWGDAGMIYFWIREQDARDGRFEKVHLVLQCH
jgi:uncharacterized protein YwqG